MAFSTTLRCSSLCRLPKKSSFLPGSSSSISASVSIPFRSFSCNVDNRKRNLSIRSVSTQVDRWPWIVEDFLALIKLCVSSKTLQQIHTQLLIHSFRTHNFLLAKLIILKDFNYANLLFTQIPKPNDYAFNVMIRGLTTTWQKFNLSLEFYYKMKLLGIKPNNFTFPFVFISCANLVELQHGRAAHSMVFKYGLGVDCHVRHSLITMYARCSELRCARKVFDEITDRDLVSWNSMISGYSKMGFAGDAVALFREMSGEGFEPDEMTLVSVLGACGELGDLKLGSSIEEFVGNSKLKLNSYIGSSLIGMYSKCGDLVSARRIFDKMAQKDIVTWNAMITGYAQNGLSEEAISIFDVMKETGCKPNNITLVGVLSACSSIGALDLGKWIDEYASQSGLQQNIYVTTALIDMYAKCGCLDHALKVFDKMPERNVVSWNAMISALAFHGQAEKALSLFDCMLKEGEAAGPNDITFVAILSACVHAGLVDEGRRLFDEMTSSFKLVPKIEHYSCMIDLLARSGLIYEAWDVVQRMPEKPDEIALGALLGACHKLRNVEITERVMKLLLEIEPSNSGNYIISSKIYANLKMWDDSARMRLLMREKGVMKTPGFSCIEMNSQIHEFHSGDYLHLSSQEIHQTLDDLYEEMKIEGYVPNVNIV